MDKGADKGGGGGYLRQCHEMLCRIDQCIQGGASDPAPPMCAWWLLSPLRGYCCCTSRVVCRLPRAAHALELREDEQELREGAAQVQHSEGLKGRAAGINGALQENTIEGRETLSFFEKDGELCYFSPHLQLQQNGLWKLHFEAVAQARPGRPHDEQTVQL